MFAEIQKISKVPLMGIGRGGEIEESPQMTAQMLLWGHRRISIEEMMNMGPPMSVSINHLDDGFNSTTVKSDMVKAYTNQIVSVLRDLVKINPLLKEHMNHIVSRMDVTDPFGLADFAAYITTADGEELQRILETLDAEERLNRVLTLLMKERELADLQQEISRKVEEKVNENQRKYLLNEQLKSIKKELGMEKDDKDTLITKYQKAIDESGLPEDSAALQAMKDELQKLSFLEKNSSEFNVTRTYLDWLTCLPWTTFSKDSLDIPKARLILDEDHYGLSDIKDRILEFIAVGQLTGSVDGRIICFVGPPGTGKTSIAKSIARALNREFYRFSVGGLSDVSEIKGHRRTYVGAMPGKIVQCMKQTNVSNPLLLIDEIDKLASHGRGGDPASALLELLDPNQNDSFMDHYLDVPVDLSKVIFVCTANVLENIPGPLMDRMEIIRLSGYDLPEKVNIAKNYLEPKARKESGLLAGEGRTPEKLEIETGALESLARWWCREAGVRNLEKHINKIYRKVALQVVDPASAAKKNADGTAGVAEERGEDFFKITADKLPDYVGQRVFTSDRMYETTQPGVVMGLAWTSMGGATLYIETTSRGGGKAASKQDGDSKAEALQPGAKGSLIATGQLGDVMTESTRIAHTVAKRILQDKTSGDNSYLDTTDIHLHVPEGATKKDGPSAGCTMVTALISLAMEVPVRQNFAMTGEISLTGKVMKIGGVKEKIIAARRSGVTCVVLPEGNTSDYEELPEYLKEGMEVHFADVYEDVYRVAFQKS